MKPIDTLVDRRTEATYVICTERSSERAIVLHNIELLKLKKIQTEKSQKNINRETAYNTKSSHKHKYGSNHRLIHKPMKSILRKDGERSTGYRVTWKDQYQRGNLNHTNTEREIHQLPKATITNQHQSLQATHPYIK